MKIQHETRECLVRKCDFRRSIVVHDLVSKLAPMKLLRHTMNQHCVTRNGREKRNGVNSNINLRNRSAKQKSFTIQLRQRNIQISNMFYKFSAQILLLLLFRQIKYVYRFERTAISTVNFEGFSKYTMLM